MKLVLDGLDLTAHISNDEGYAIEYVQYSNADSITTLNGQTYSGRMKIKVALEVTLDPLNEAMFKQVITKLDQKYVRVTYDDPRYGNNREIYAIPSDFTAELVMVDEDGVSWWGGLGFTLEER